MAALSNHFPNMTPEELDEFRRHSGMYTVTHWDDGLGCYVSSRYRSVTYALEMAGREDTEEQRRALYCEMHDKGSAKLDTGSPGYPVTIYPPDPWERAH